MSTWILVHAHIHTHDYEKMEIDEFLLKRLFGTTVEDRGISSAILGSMRDCKMEKGELKFLLGVNILPCELLDGAGSEKR